MTINYSKNILTSHKVIRLNNRKPFTSTRRGYEVLIKEIRTNLSTSQVIRGEMRENHC